VELMSRIAEDDAYFNFVNRTAPSPGVELKDTYLNASQANAK
jgi:hypothetical protein